MPQWVSPDWKRIWSVIWSSALPASGGPASSSSTVRAASSVRRVARATPAEPPPTMMSSYSATRLPLGSVVTPILTDRERRTVLRRGDRHDGAGARRTVETAEIGDAVLGD